MSDTVICVENLGKKYVIRHHKQERYTALRDVIVDGAKSFGRKLMTPFGQNMTAQDYEEFWALKDVSFEIKRGDRVGIIGYNGAGKSTLLKILSRITEPTTGRVSIKGRVASLIEVGTGFHPELTGRENIYLNGAILGMSQAEIKNKFDEIVTFAEVDKFLDTPVKRYSSGMYVRLAFAVAAHLEPEILIVDEVLAVGDAAFQKKCLGKMEDVAKNEGRTVFFVSHNMASIKLLCQTGVFLRAGRILYKGYVDKAIATYTEHIEENIEKNQYLFPIKNHKYNLFMNNCQVNIIKKCGFYNLLVELDIETTNPLKEIGVGLSVTSLDGTKISLLAPAVTNYVIPEINGHCSCILSCENINQYIAGGEYVIGVWLSKPRTEYLIQVNAIAKITIPPIDVFKSGVYFENHLYGSVPLPLKMSFSNSLIPKQ